MEVMYKKSVTMDRGIENSYVVPMFRIPIESAGVVFNYDKGKMIGNVYFDVYRYSQHEFNKCKFYCYFGKQTNEDNSETLSTVYRLDGERIINVYSRVKDGYIYVYVRPFNQYDNITLQVNYTTNITFIEFIEGEKELYSDISSQLKPCVDMIGGLQLTPNSANYWKVESSYLEHCNIDYPNHVFYRTSLYCQDNTPLNDGSLVCTITKPPKKSFFTICMYKTFTDQLGMCIIRVGSDGTVKIYGMTSGKGVQVNLYFDYYI